MTRPALPKGLAASRAWNAALRLKEFTQKELAIESGVATSTLWQILADWRAEGHCRRLEGRSPTNRSLYRMATPAPTIGKLASGLKQTPHQNMWLAMRKLDVFTPRDIAAIATTPEVEVTEQLARSYCQQLLRAGYLMVLEKARPPARPAVYRLVRDTGRTAPRKCRITVLFDPNLDEIVHGFDGDTA